MALAKTPVNRLPARRELAKKFRLTGTYLAALLCGLAGLLLTVMASLLGVWSAPSFGSAIFGSLASTLLVAAIVSVVWESFSKTAIIGEFWSEYESLANIRASGVERAVREWKSLPWDELLADSRDVEIVLRQGVLMLEYLEDILQAFVARPQVSLRVYLPDEDSEALVSAIGRSLGGRSVERTRESILRSVSIITGLNVEQTSTCSALATSLDPQLALYRFDDKYVFASHSHGKGKRAVPHFLCRGGIIGEFLDREIEAIRDCSTLRPIVTAERMLAATATAGVSAVVARRTDDG